MPLQERNEGVAKEVDTIFMKRKEMEDRMRAIEERKRDIAVREQKKIEGLAPDKLQKCVHCTASRVHERAINHARCAVRWTHLLLLGGRTPFLAPRPVPLQYKARFNDKSFEAGQTPNTLRRWCHCRTVATRVASRIAPRIARLASSPHRCRIVAGIAAA